MVDHVKHFPPGISLFLRLSSKWGGSCGRRTPSPTPHSSSSHHGSHAHRSPTPENRSTSPQARTSRLYNHCPAFVLALTFVVYAGFHASRRPISVAKPALHHPTNCTSTISNGSGSIRVLCPPDWVPFDGPNYNELFGALDMAYLASYAVAMFVAGHLAERLPIRTFLTVGMVGSGLLTAAFGLGYFADIHSLTYYYVVQIVGGIFQSTGWPSVVTCVAAWYGKRKKGLIFGLWNAHTSVGNIVGGLLAAAWVNYAWGWSFVVPGALLVALSAVVYLFLVPSPEEYEDCVTTSLKYHQGTRRRGTVSRTTSPTVPYGDYDEKVSPPNSTNGSGNGEDANGAGLGTSANYDETTQLLTDPSGARSQNVNHHGGRKPAISFAKAIRVPGVAEFSLCLFFAKAVSYTFLYWLPNYISASSSLDPGKAAQLASVFDFGGILGGVIAGFVADATDASASVCAIMLGLSCPLIYYYHGYGHINYTINVILLFTTGLFVNGPYALITTAVSADLGNKIGASHHAKALATITAIIDGSGSLGAALGPLIAGLVASKSWWNVFCMLIIADILAILFLIRLSFREMKLMYELKKDRII